MLSGVGMKYCVNGCVNTKHAIVNVVTIMSTDPPAPDRDNFIQGKHFLLSHYERLPL